MLRTITLSTAALIALSASALADQTITTPEGTITIHDPAPKSQARVTVGNIYKDNAELTFNLASTPGATASFSISPEGDVNTAAAKLDASSTENVSRTGKVFADAVNTTETDSYVVEGKAAKLLYNYLHLTRRLSVRLGEESSSIVGNAITCDHTYEGNYYSCTIGFDGIDQ